MRPSSLMPKASLEIETKASPDSIETKQDKFRWIILIVLCICVYAYVYCYNNPFALQDQLQKEYDLSGVEYNLFYSVYGYVNFVSPVVAGLLIDYIGINSSALSFMILIVIGQSLWVFGTMTYSYSLMLLGRTIFGSGAQPFHQTRKYYCYEYFIGKEYSFASSITLMTSRFASATQAYVTTIVYDSTESIPAALSVGLGLSIIASILFILFIIYRKLKLNPNVSFSHIFIRNKNKKETQPLIDEKQKEGQIEKSLFNLDGLWNGAFDRRYWILLAALVFFYCSYESFSNISSSFLQSKYNQSYNTANSLAPIPFFIAVFTMPIFGFIADRYGKRCQLLLLSSFLLFIGHSMLGLGNEMNTHIAIPIIGLISFGFGMSIASAIFWPAVGLVCTKQYLATALGFTSSMDNVLSATSFLIVGALTDDNGGVHQYEYVTYYLLCLTLCMTISICLLWYFDKTQFDDVLNKREAKYDKNQIDYAREQEIQTNKQ